MQVTIPTIILPVELLGAYHAAAGALGAHIELQVELSAAFPALTHGKARQLLQFILASVLLDFVLDLVLYVFAHLTNGLGHVGPVSHRVDAGAETADPLTRLKFCLGLNISEHRVVICG